MVCNFSPSGRIAAELPSRRPNDDQEHKCFDITHAMMLEHDNHRLHHAPVENPQRVLDVGAGSGIWAIDFADKFPSAIVTGTDLSPPTPFLVPPNCHFQLEDANTDWTYERSTFDLVHFRHLAVRPLCCLAPTSKLLTRYIRGVYTNGDRYMAKHFAASSLGDGLSIPNSRLLLPRMTGRFPQIASTTSGKKSLSKPPA